MWLLKAGRDTRRSTATLGAAFALTAALLSSGCGADYVENSEASVLLQIMSINEGAQLDSDVRNGEFSSFVCENEVDVEVTVENKNPNGPSAPSSAVQLDSYEIRYTRSDGRGTEGVDVPYRVTGTLALTVPVGDDATFPLEVVRRQAKLDPPLNNINQTTILTVSAQVTLYGKTVSEKRVSASARFQIDFADFGDEETSCPAN
jgi:hypothetical protein